MKHFVKKMISIYLIMTFMSSLITVPVAWAEEDEYDRLREKWVEFLTGGTSYDETDPLVAAQITALTDTADTQWNALNKEQARTYLWTDLKSTSISAQHTTAFTRIYQMALAYRTRGSSLEGNQTLLADIIGALEWMNQNRYSTSIVKYDNWWDWDIGVPRQLNNTLCLLYDDIPSDLLIRLTDAIHYYAPSATYANGNTTTGANRVWLSSVIAIRGILVKDSSRIAHARDALTAVFAYVTRGDGFYRDGSFIQHTAFAYTGAYGLSLIYEMTNLMYLLEGSSWEVTVSSKSNIFNWIYDSFEPLVYKGQLMNMVAGREISRYMATPHSAGNKLMQTLAILAQMAPETDRQAFAGMIKRWSEEDTFLDFYSGLPIFTLLKARELAAAAQTGTNYTGVKIFARMDRAVMQRPGFAVGLAMYSRNNEYRTVSYESINNENKKGWYTAAGALYLYNNDLAQYAEHFWPTVNSFRIPGTTVLRSKGVTKSSASNEFAGGTSLNGMYGVAGMRYTPATYNLDAKKSYFMFDDELVAVGTVSSTDAAIPAETIMENRKINGDNVLTVDGGTRAETSGVEDDISNAGWVHLAGNVDGSDIGYYLPDRGDLSALRETRTDKWSSINTNYSTPENSQNRTNSFMTLWFNHGIAPSAAPYAYALLPNKSAAETQSYSNNPDFEIVAQTESVHAVKENTLGITAANFWTDETVTAAGITSDKRASVIMCETPGSLSASVADPTQLNTGPVTVSFDLNATAVVSLDPNVTVLSYEPLCVSVNVNGKRGVSATMEFEVEILSPLEKLGVKLVKANTLYHTISTNTGTQPGQYEVLVVENLYSQIQSAQAVYDNPASTEEQLNNAADSLQAVMNLCVPIPVPTPTPAPTPIATVIVDNTDSAFTTDSAWTVSTYTPGYYGPDYANDGTSTEADPDKWAKWTPDITIPGTYDIYMWWTTSTNRPVAAPLEIRHSEGIDTSKTVNQQQNNGKWVFVGTYDLTAGTGNYVKILATDTGATIADAVKFECMSAAEVDKTALGDILSQANTLYAQANANVGTGDDQYPADKVAALWAAIVDGEAVYADETATWAAVNGAVAALLSAIANCVVNSEIPTPEPTPAPTPEPTPTPVPVTGERILLDDNFNSYTDLAAMQNAGWVITGTPVLATVAAEENLKYVRTPNGSSASSIARTFEPVPLKASAGESPGKNAKLVISFDTYASGGSGSAQAYYKVFDSISSGNAVSAGRRGSTAALRYSKSIASGSTDFLISSWFARFKKIKFVVKFTDETGAFITPKVDIYYDNMDTPVTDGASRNMIDTGTARVDKFSMNTNASGPNFEVDNLKIVLQTDVASADKSGLTATLEDAHELFAMASENTGIEPGQYDPAVAAALSSAITSAQGVLENAAATQEEVNTAIASLEAAIMACVPNPADETPEPTIEPTPAPDHILSGDEHIAVNQATKKISYPHYKIGTVNYHYLAAIKSKLSSANGYTYEVAEADGATAASGTVTEPTHKVIVSYEGTPVATYTFIAAIQYGDVNGDGAITASDLGLLKKYLMNKTVNAFIKPYGVLAADINKTLAGTNPVTATDLGLLKRYLMSKTAYPISEPTTFAYDPAFA